MDLINDFLTYAGTEAGERAINVGLAVLAAIGAVLLWVFGILGKLWNALFSKKEEPKETTPTYEMKDQAQTGFAEATSGFATGANFGSQTINQGTPLGSITLTAEEFQVLLQRERDAAIAKAADASAITDTVSEQKERAAVLEAKLANPELALEEHKERATQIEQLLDDVATQQALGENRIRSALVGFAKLEYEEIDALLAETEENAILTAANAAYGRGLVAEDAIKWNDAYRHYKRAAELGEMLEHRKAHARMTWKLQLLDEAIPVYKKLLEETEAEFGRNTAETAEQLNNLALLLKNAGRYQEAEPLYREALEIGRETLGERHPDYATGLNNLAALLRVTGRFEEAEPLYREALEIGRETLGERHPDYAQSLNNLAALLQATGRFEEAEPLYREALEIGRETLGERHPDYATRLNNLAALLQATGRFEEAEPLYREALVVVEAALGAEHPHTKLVRGNLEGFLNARGGQ